MGGTSESGGLSLTPNPLVLPTAAAATINQMRLFQVFILNLNLKALKNQFLTKNILFLFLNKRFKELNRRVKNELGIVNRK